MAVIARRIKRFSGTITADGTGAGTVDVAPGAAGGAFGSPSYKLIKYVLISGEADGTLPITGGSVIVRDNSGAGSAVNNTHTQASELAAAGAKVEKYINARAIVTNVRISGATWGAGRKVRYALWFARTKAQA